MKLIAVAAGLIIGGSIFRSCSRPMRPATSPATAIVIKPQKPNWIYYTRTDPMTDQVTHYEELDNQELDSQIDDSMIVLSCNGPTQTFLIRDGHIFGNGYSDVLLRFDKQKAVVKSILYSDGSLEAITEVSKKSIPKDFGYSFPGETAAYILDHLINTSELRIRAKSVAGVVDLDFDIRGAQAALDKLTADCKSSEHTEE